MRCHVEDVCRRMLIFSRKVLKDRGKADTMSASAKPCVHGFWRTWMARVGDPVMMRTTVSLFIRKFTPGDATSRRDVPFAVGVRGVYDSPTLRAMHSIHKCVANTLKTMNSVQKNSQIRNFCTEFLHFTRSAKITAFCMAKSHIFVFFL